MSAAFDAVTFDLDVARQGWRPAIERAAVAIAAGTTDFGAELDELLAETVPPLLRSHPRLDDLAVGGELTDALTDAVLAHERAIDEGAAVLRAPGLLQRRRSATGTELTGLRPYFPAVTEPRAEALARQTEAIRSTILEGARIGAANRELRRRRNAELPFLEDPTPAAKGALTRRLHRELAAELGFAGGRIPTAPRALVTGAQGSGKTRGALETLAQLRQSIAARYAAPTIEKAAEALDTYRAVAQPWSLPAMLVRGRSARDPATPDEAMCPRHEAAERVSRASLSVAVTMCSTCPLRDACGYRRQAAEIASLDGVGVFFQAHASLTTSSPAPAADLLVLDERLAVEDPIKVPLDCLSAETLPYRGGPDLARYQAAHVTLEALNDAVRRPHQLAALRSDGIERRHLADAAELLRPLAEPPPLPAGLTDKQIEAALRERDIPAAAGALAIVRAVLREIDAPRPGLNAMTLDRHGDAAVCRLKRLHGCAGAAVLALDGTGDAELVRHVFGARLQHIECRVERDAHVSAPIGKAYSRQSLTGADRKGRPIAAKEASSRKLRDDVASIVARLPSPCLVVAAEAAETALLDHLPPDTPTAHFGALRGKNAWEHCQSVITAGPAPIGLDDVELLARCYMAEDPQPFASSVGPVPDDWGLKDRGWPFWCTRMRRMRDGTLQPVEVPIHPDPRVQRVLEQVREAEAVQAIDRTRPVWNRRHVVTLDSLALDLTYDACPSHRELVAGGTRWERAWSAEGVLPLGPADLHKAHPELFRTPSVARDWLKTNGGGSQIIPLFGVPPHLVGTVIYRRQGQRGQQSRALIDLDRHPDPRAALTALLGPLVWFELLPAPRPPVHVPSPAARPIVVPAELLPPEPPKRRPRMQHNATCVAPADPPPEAENHPPPELIALPVLAWPPDPYDPEDLAVLPPEPSTLWRPMPTAWPGATP